MSRSGYTDDNEDPLAHGRWRQAVRRSLEGKRGQATLRELADALDAMPEKRLYAGSFATAEGEFCTLGALGAKRGTKMDDLGDEYDCEPERVGERFGIAPAMAAEIMYLNDEYMDFDWKTVSVVICGPMPDYRYTENSRGLEISCRAHERHERQVRIGNPNAARDRWNYMRNWVRDHLMAHPEQPTPKDTPT